MMYLHCRDISYHYPESNSPVLDKVNCSFNRPGFHAIFGPSGVGKSSFARLIADSNRYNYQGSLEYTGIDTILYTYNLERLPGWASAGAHLNKVTGPQKEELKRRLIDIFKLSSVIHSRFRQLSMGQQNRINLIRYLLQDFDLLILDESLANVDEKLRQAIILAIKQIFPENMFLYISHNLMEVATYCDEIVVFGRNSSGKTYRTVQGQNCGSATAVDRPKVDGTMLEIMNAF